MHADAEINRRLTPEEKLSIYAQMVRLRVFDDHAMKQYQEGKMSGFLLLQTGQEAVAVAVRSLLRPTDHTICGGRGMGHALTAGLSMNAGMAELFGKVTGSAQGRGGAWGFWDVEHQHWGNHPLAGTQTALATGLAFGIKHRGEDSVAVCFLGEGSMNQGVVHEAFNLAALFRLPVLFVLENNRYSMGTSVPRGSATAGPLARRAEGYGMPWEALDTDTIYEIRARVHPHLEATRRDHQPAIIEIPTYRFEGFSIADANKLKYRTKAEIEDRMLHHDPILLWQQQLESEGLFPEGHPRALLRAMTREAECAVIYASESDLPKPEELWKNIYWSHDHAQHSGALFFDHC
jgi:pyruvate dehydrogenase E1 component alpha subunit